jgi:phosphonate transport system ATP-binding protein
MRVAIERVSVTYRGGIAALRGVDLEVAEGKITVLIGPSGAGKTTLLRCLNGFVRPTSGEIRLGDTDIVKANSATIRRLRRAVAVIPQHFNLVKRASVATNVLTGRLGHVGLMAGLLGAFSREDLGLAGRNVSRMELDGKADRRVDTLSGGEQQRVAIARALTQQPAIIVADEPVSNLDQELAIRIMEIFKRINREDGITMVIALHDLRVAERYADRIVALDRGVVVYSGGFAGLTSGKPDLPAPEEVRA